MINAEKNNTYVATPSGTTDITLGTSYEINKNLVEKYEKALTEEEIKEKKFELLDFVITWEDKYFMLLCKDRSDYTIFHLVDSQAELIDILVDECLKNRGIIKGIDSTEDKCAIEIWLSIEGESYAYYFFPYEAAVIEA